MRLVYDKATPLELKGDRQMATMVDGTARRGHRGLAAPVMPADRKIEMFLSVARRAEQQGDLYIVRTFRSMANDAAPILAGLGRVDRGHQS